VKTTWSKEKIMGINLLPSTAEPLGLYNPEKKSKTWYFNRRGKYLVRTPSKALFSTPGRALKNSTSSFGIFETQYSNESALFEDKSEEINLNILSIVAIAMVGFFFVGFSSYVVYRRISCTKKLKIKFPSEKLKTKKEKHPLRAKKPNFEKISIGEDLPLNAPEVKTTWNCARHP
jgi:hypothetical protein